MLLLPQSVGRVWRGRAGRAWGCCEPWTGRCVFQGLGVSLEDGPGFSQVEKIVNYPGREEPGEEKPCWV